MTTSRRYRILFVNDEPFEQISTFIKQDFDFLRRDFDPEYFSLHPFKHARFDALLQPRFWKLVRRADLVYVWFGGNAPAVLLAKLMGKPAVIVGGGCDVVSMPEIGYGVSAHNRMKRWLETAGFRRADTVLLFSDASRRDFLALPGARPDKCRTLYLSVDPERFRPSGEKKNQVLTVGYISESNLRRKGLLTFVETARRTPEIKFKLVGKVTQRTAAEKIRAIMPPNLELCAYDDNELLLRNHIPREYQESKVYMQVSCHEGFGVALAEAMSCGCVPVVTDRGAMPEVVGDTGRFVPVEDADAASTAVRSVISSFDAAASERCRARIVEHFSHERRYRELAAVVNGMVRHAGS